MGSKFRHGLLEKLLSGGVLPDTVKLFAGHG